MIEIQCPQCQAKLEVEENTDFDDPLKCPICKQHFCLADITKQKFTGPTIRLSLPHRTKHEDFEEVQPPLDEETNPYVHHSTDSHFLKKFVVGIWEVIVSIGVVVAVIAGVCTTCTKVVRKAWPAVGVGRVGSLIYQAHNKNEEKRKNDEEAILFLEQRAEQRDACAQYNLGVYYYNGEDVDKDHEKAVYWWEKSAELGYTHAQYVLGRCYFNGVGVAKNLEKAVYWWKLSAEQGNEEAIKALEENKACLSEL